MPPVLRQALLVIGVGTVCALSVTVALGATGRQTILVTTPAVSSTGSSFDPGVLTGGDATVSKTPDIAFLSVGVESIEPSAAAAQKDLADKAGRLIARAKALGIPDKDVATSGYSIGPNYAEPQNVINGYRASESLELKWHDVNSTGRAVDDLVQNGGATQVGVSFGLADPKAAQSEARSLAIADARSRAAAMASAAGVRLGSVLRITDLSIAGGVTPRVEFAAPAAASTTQIPIGTLNVTVTVEVDFAIGA